MPYNLEYTIQSLNYDWQCEGRHHLQVAQQVPEEQCAEGILNVERHLRVVVVKNALVR